MTKDDKRTLTPRLRFPEFRDAPGWSVDRLGAVAEFVNERVAVEEIALKDYISTENILADFGGVTTASKLPPTGSVTQFRGDDILVSNIRPYLKKVWLSDRDGGASNDIIVIRPESAISKTFFPFIIRNESFIDYVMTGAKGVKMPRGDIGLMKCYPVSYPARREQQKIADCLTSLDELIAGQGRKVEALKVHKQGLMQRLFPRAGETLPRLRFPDFRDAPEWGEKTLGDIAQISSGTTPLRANSEFYEGGAIPWVKTTDLNNSFIDSTEECITPKAKAIVNPVGSVLVAMYGGFKQIGRTGYLRTPAATNQALSVLRANQDEVLPIFLLAWLNARIDDWKRIASSSRKDPNITGSDVARFPIHFPSTHEQRRIADCLSALDAAIAAEADKLAALKTHKRGLMRQLFPSPEGD